MSLGVYVYYFGPLAHHSSILNFDVTSSEFIRLWKKLEAKVESSWVSYTQKDLDPPMAFFSRSLLHPSHMDYSKF